HRNATLLRPQHELQPRRTDEREAVRGLWPQRKGDDPVVFVFHGQQRYGLGRGHGRAFWVEGRRKEWPHARPTGWAAVSMPLAGAVPRAGEPEVVPVQRGRAARKM